MGLSADSARHYKALIDSPRLEQNQQKPIKRDRSPGGGVESKKEESKGGEDKVSTKATKKNVLLEVNMDEQVSENEEDILEKSFSFIGRPKIKRIIPDHPKFEAEEVTQTTLVVKGTDTTKRKNSARILVLSNMYLTNLISVNGLVD